MSKFEFQVGVHDGLIVVLNEFALLRDLRNVPGSAAAPPRAPKTYQRSETHVDKARQAANAKAREWVGLFRSVPARQLKGSLAITKC